MEYRQTRWDGEMALLTKSFGGEVGAESLLSDSTRVYGNRSHARRWHRLSCGRRCRALTGLSAFGALASWANQASMASATKAAKSGISVL